MCYNNIALKGARMTFKDIEKILKKDGWYHYDTVGSHMQYKHRKKQGKVTIPNHKGDVKKGTLNSILKQAGIKK